MTVCCWLLAPKNDWISDNVSNIPHQHRCGLPENNPNQRHMWNHSSIPRTEILVQHQVIKVKAGFVKRPSIYQWRFCFRNFRAVTSVVIALQRIALCFTDFIRDLFIFTFFIALNWHWSVELMMTRFRNKMRRTNGFHKSDVIVEINKVWRETRNSVQVHFNWGRRKCWKVTQIWKYFVVMNNFDF